MLCQWTGRTQKEWSSDDQKNFNGRTVFHWPKESLAFTLEKALALTCREAGRAAEVCGWKADCYNTQCRLLLEAEDTIIDHIRIFPKRQFT